MNNEVIINDEIRKRAADYLNATDRTAGSGLQILKDANYKPHVTAIFERNISRKDIPAKIVSEIRLLLRYHANPTAEIHADKLPGDAGSDDGGNTEDVDLTASEKFIILSNDEYPDTIKMLIRALAAMYKARSDERKALILVGEGADDESVAKRKAIAVRIVNIGDAIAELGEIFQNFTDGKEINMEELAELLSKPVDLDKPLKEEAHEGKEEKDFVLAENVEGLKKQSDNWRTKLVKAENRLLYQSDTKSEKENPMPEGPKRIKQVKRIEKLTAEKLQIDTRLAELS